MKKLIIAVVVLAVVTALIAMNVRRASSKAIRVDTVEVVRKDLVAQVSGSGRVEARHSVSITANVVGKVLEVAVEEGDSVEKGQLILRIDPGERKAALEQMRATLARQEAQAELAAAELRQADAELRRIRGLVDGGLRSDQDLEGAQTSRDVKTASRAAALESVRNARAGVDHAEYELGKTIIHAEIPGVVVRLSVEEGENVLAGDLYNSGSAIVVIADPAEMEAQILIDETEVVSVRKGQSATVTVDAFPDLDLTGHVLEVGNSAYNAGPLGSQEAKDFRVRVLLDEVPPAFRPGLSARAEIVTEEREGALAVPIEALTLRDPEREKERADGGRRRSRRDRKEPAGEGESEEVEGVFVLDDGKARFVPVETGIAGEKDFEVLTGLAEGDLVIRGPFDAIRDLTTGDKIKAKKDRSGGRRNGDSEEAGPDAEDE